MMDCPEPVDPVEYLALYNANVRFFGLGYMTSMSVPCPFCAAPDFMIYKVLEVQKKMEEGATCGCCRRSARAVFSDTPTGKRFEIFQTAGPAAPEWLQPKLRWITDVQ